MEKFTFWIKIIFFQELFFIICVNAEVFQSEMNFLKTYFKLKNKQSSLIFDLFNVYKFRFAKNTSAMDDFWCIFIFPRIQVYSSMDRLT